MRVVLLSLMAIGAGCAPATAPDASIDAVDDPTLDGPPETCRCHTECGCSMVW